MGRTAAGLVTAIGRGADGLFRIAARIVDDGTSAKIRHGVLIGFKISSRFINLVDRPGGLDKTTMWKASIVMEKTEEELSPFARAFLAQFRKSVSDTLAPAFDGLHDGRPAPDPDPRDALRAAFAGGPHFQNLFDLRQELPPPQALFASMATRDNPHRDALLASTTKPGESVNDTYPMLRGNGDAPAASGSMQKAAKAAQARIAANYRGHAYDFLKSNSNAPR